MFVYVITNKINGKQYVGQTIRTLRRRFMLHSNDKRSHALSHAFTKYGRENFKIDLLEVCASLPEMDEFEKLWIERLNTISPNGYNLRSGGQGKGKTIHEETRTKLREAWKRRASDSDETRAKKSINQKNRILANKELFVSYLRKSYGHSRGKPRNARSIFCITTGKTFRCVADAAKFYSLDVSTVYAVARGKWSHTKGFQFRWGT